MISMMHTIDRICNNENLYSYLLLLTLLMLSACTGNGNLSGIPGRTMVSTVDELARMPTSTANPSTSTPVPSRTPGPVSIPAISPASPHPSITPTATSLFDTQMAATATRAYKDLRRVSVDDKPWTRFENKNIYAMAIISEQDIWFFSDHLLHFDGTQIISYTMPTMPDFIVTTNPVVDQAGNMWVAAGKNGFYRFDGRQWYHYPIEQGLPSQVDKILIGPDKTLWALMKQSGSLYRFNGRTWEFYWSLQQDYRQIYGIEAPNGTIIEDMAIDADGKFWIALFARFAVLDDLKLQYPLDLTSSIGECGFRDVQIASDGSIWIGSCARGILIHYIPNQAWTKYDVPEMTSSMGGGLYIAPDDSVWTRLEMVPVDEELRVFQWDGKRWTVYEGFPIFDGQYYRSVLALAVTNHGTLWLSTGDALYRYKP